MFLKVMWNREGWPIYTMIHCESYIVEHSEDDDGWYVHVATKNSDNSICLRGKSEIFAMNSDGRTVDRIRA